tara:strand:+ start:142 stop:531 length:390 start_codon:yes stop_codon:yes gene_type:complete
MVQNKRVLFNENVNEVRPYDLEKSEVMMKRSGCLPDENEDLILHHPDKQKSEWRRRLQMLRKQDETIKFNISKIHMYIKNCPMKDKMTNETLNSIIEQLDVKMNLLRLKQEGIESHRRICSENNLVSCM